MHSDSCSRLLSRSWHCIFSAHICAGSVRSVSRQSWRQSERLSRIRYSLHRCRCGTRSTCCSLMGHIFFAALPSLRSAFWAYTSCKREQQMRSQTVCSITPSENRKILKRNRSYFEKQKKLKYIRRQKAVRSGRAHCFFVTNYTLPLSICLVFLS